MAKKGKEVQLIADVHNDEEWDKMLAKDGLIVIDIYSEWSGPCTAMHGLLKKVKLEQGGDFLHLVTAKSDSITALQRFAGKSEPAWMFIANGQMVKLFLGANAPALLQHIQTELKNEREASEGTRERIVRRPDEYSEVEKVQYEEQLKKQKMLNKLEVERQHRQLTDRRLAQARNILDTMAHVGLILAFPHCARTVLEFLQEYWPNSGLALSKKERPILTEEMLEDIEFFSINKIDELSRTDLCSGQHSYALMVTQEEGVPTPIDDTVLKFVYGGMMHSPGTEDSLARKMQKDVTVCETEATEEEEVVAEGEEADITEERPSEGTVVSFEKDKEKEKEKVEQKTDRMDGLWAPSNDLVKATALKYFFPLITAPLIIPEPPPVPDHIAVAFPSSRTTAVFSLIEEHKEEVMAYGFFTNQDYKEAKCVAKNKRDFELLPEKDATDAKLILKVSKKHSDLVLTLAQMGPTYMSVTPELGKKECSVLFPEGYLNDEREPSVLLRGPSLARMKSLHTQLRKQRLSLHKSAEESVSSVE